MSEKKLKVLQALYCLSRGGAERLAIDITKELNKREGIEARLISFYEGKGAEYDTAGIPYQFCPSSVKLPLMGKNKLYAEEFRKTLDDFKPDIIHSHSYISEIITRFEVYDNVKYFTHCHDNFREFAKWSYTSLSNKKKITNYLERSWLFKRYEKCNNNFIAISKNTEAFFKKNLPENLKNNVFLLNNAIDFNRFFKPDLQGKVMRQINLISTGSLIDGKNHLFLIELVKNLHARKYKITLEILGEGINRKKLEGKIDEYNLNEIIFLRGVIQNVEDYLHKANIYVHAAKYESFGLVLLEAMAAGLPVICLDGGGNRDIIEQGKNGFMIYEKKPELFVQAIIDLVANPLLYNKMSAYAIEYARKFDIKLYVDRLLEIYRK